ncbi:MAG TPA: class I poly(R)-hydroxyalkanoic acid synthase, partial [Ottowia sp.]|nr:class I poly(R)-hydroxyalkanoic acid synthase [Ottowia sp.]
MNPSNNPWQAMSAGLPESMLGAAMGQGFAETWIKAFQHFQNLDLGKGAGEAPSIDVPQLKFSPEALAKLQQDYVAEASQLWNQSLQANPTIKDKRFAGEAWSANPLASFTAAVYLLNARTLMAMAEAVEGDAKAKNRVRFAVEQWMAAAAPSNYLAFNPDAQRMAIDSHGASLAKGVANMLQDMKQ